MMNCYKRSLLLGCRRSSKQHNFRQHCRDQAEAQYHQEEGWRRQGGGRGHLRGGHQGSRPRAQAAAEVAAWHQGAAGGGPDEEAQQAPGRLLDDGSRHQHHVRTQEKQSQGGIDNIITPGCLQFYFI